MYFMVGLLLFGILHICGCFKQPKDEKEDFDILQTRRDVSKGSVMPSDVPLQDHEIYADDAKKSQPLYP